MSFFAFIRLIQERSLNISAKGIVISIFKSRKSYLSQSSFLFVCHDNSRSLKIDKKLFAPIIDPIISDIGIKSTITFALPFSKFYGKSCYGNTIVYSRILLIAYFMRTFCKKIDFNNYQRDPLVKAWLRILNIVKPYVVIGINPSVELCLAAKKMGIISIDVQHGILATYNYYGTHKRELLAQKGWPDYIFCWDTFSKDFILNNTPSTVRPVITGNPAYASNFFYELLETKENYSVSTTDRKTILLTLDSLCPPEMEDDLAYKALGIPFGIIDFIKQHGSFFRWFIRLHPAQMINKKKKIYKELERLFFGFDNVFWDIPSSVPLIVCMKYVQLHITYNSATTREAFLFNIKTIILDQNIKNINSYFGDLVVKNFIKILSPLNHEEIVQYIDVMIQDNGESNAVNNQFGGNYQKVIGVLNEVAESGSLNCLQKIETIEG